MKRLIKLLTGRLSVTIVLILVQLLALFAVVINISLASWLAYVFLTMLSFILAILIVSDDLNPTFKMTWLIAMLAFPVLGWLLHLLFGRRKISDHMRRRYERIISASSGVLTQNGDTLDEIEDLSVRRQCEYILNTVGAPVFKNTSAEFFPTGEKFFERYIEKLKTAEKFILIEYFIIEEGRMWNPVLDILREKAAKGVAVMVMYDDLGTINTLPPNYDRKLRSLGIQTTIFNSFRPSLDVFLNYRDHRKITVIDGVTAFTGGLNLADEYINQKVRFGYWKDSAVMICGEAVQSMTVMFLQLWYYANNEKKTDFSRFIQENRVAAEGYVQPFGDGPMDNHLTGKLSYMEIINRAKRYVWISTPYLILDSEMITALRLAAASGIDVRIVTPKVPDKWYVHAVTRSNYEALIHFGVKIYEYSPGFIHEKAIVSDDEISIIGTVNFDFRSFYLHFENGVLFYRSPIIADIKEDYLDLLQKSREITIEMATPKNIITRFGSSLLRLFSPFL